MQICLVRCPSPFLIDDKLFPPLGLMAVGTSLELEGHSVFIYDGDNIPSGFNYYGFGPTTPEYSYALRTKEILLSSNPGARFVIGGPFATLQPDKCIEDGWDCIVIGDGEDVCNDAFTKKDTVIAGGENPLDDYPIINRSLVDIKNYKYFLDDRLATTIMTGRGCPFNCGFCCKNHCSVRLKSADKIIEEINYLHDTFEYDALAFPEDLFIINKKRAETVFKYMASLGIISRCLIRADVLVKHGSEFCKMMADCGCTHVGMGVESGSDTILKNVNKGESVDTIKRAVNMLKSSGIRVKGFFIIGLPGESYETIDETKTFLDEMQLDDIDCKIFQPYPGSPIYDDKDNYDISWHDICLEDMFYKGRPGDYHGTISTSSLTTQQIFDEWVAMENKYKWQN